MPTKFIATVVAIGRDCDIALLTVADDLFWEDAPFINLEALKKSGKMIPSLEEKVSVVGYPIGGLFSVNEGENLSITSGIVSRLDMQNYSMGQHELLAVQVDAAINSGNSGGPVFDSQNNFIGVAFQGLKGEGAENIGYIIPLPVVYHFLDDVRRNGEYTGFPHLGLGLQKLEDKVLKSFLGLEESSTKGVLVGKVPHLSPAMGIVNVGDILLEIDGIPIANDGTIEFPANWAYGRIIGALDDEMDQDANNNPEEEWIDDDQMSVEALIDGLERIDLSFLISQKFVGEKCRLKLLKAPLNTSSTATLSSAEPSDPAIFDITIPNPLSTQAVPVEVQVEIVLQDKLSLVPREGTRKNPLSPYLKLPSYLLVSGLLFVPLTEMYFIAEWGEEFDSHAPIELLDLWLNADKKFADEQVIIISQVLATSENSSYEYLENTRLTKVNGVKILNLPHLATLVDSIVQSGLTGDSQDKKYIRFEFSGGFCAVFDVNRLELGNKLVLSQLGIQHTRSEDLL